MKLFDAKKILSGELKAMNLFGGYEIHLQPNFKAVRLNQKDMQFALRQLALKTVREAKARE